jgi:hypothetical protein
MFGTVALDLLGEPGSGAERKEALGKESTISPVSEEGNLVIEAPFPVMGKRLLETSLSTPINLPPLKDATGRLFAGLDCFAGRFRTCTGEDDCDGSGIAKCDKSSGG